MTEVLGMKIDDLPEGWMPVNAIVVIECVDLNDDAPDSPGIKRLSTRHTSELDMWTALGMLTAAAADLKQQYIESTEDI